MLHFYRLLTAAELVDYVGAYSTEEPVKVPRHRYTMLVLSLAAVIGPERVTETVNGGIMILGRELLPE